jgi:hypothetical protein
MEAVLHMSKPVLCVPLYTKAHPHLLALFKEDANLEPLRAITGTQVIIDIPKNIKSGDVSDIYTLINETVPTGERRYPGLQNGDVPCLWLERSATDHIVIPLPLQGDPQSQSAIITNLIGRVVDALKGGKSLSQVLALLTDGAPQDEAMLSSTVGAVQKVAIVFTAALLLYFMIVPLVVTNPSRFTQATLTGLLALLAGLATGFIGGVVTIKLEMPSSTWGKAGISAGGGVAVLVLFYLFPPWSAGQTPPPRALTMSLSRVADFTGCAYVATGKQDFARFDDEYTFAGTNLPSTYVVRAKELGGAKVMIYDLNSSASQPVGLIREAAGNVVDVSGVVKVRDGKVRVRYDWRDAHPSDKEGLTFMPGAPVSTLSAEVKLPLGKTLSNARFDERSKGSCFPADRNKWTGDFDPPAQHEIVLNWDWDVWAK